MLPWLCDSEGGEMIKEENTAALLLQKKDGLINQVFIPPSFPFTTSFKDQVHYLKIDCWLLRSPPVCLEVIMSPLCVFSLDRADLLPLAFLHGSHLPYLLLASSPSLNSLWTSCPLDSLSPTLLTLISSSPSSPKISSNHLEIWPFFHFQHCDICIFLIGGLLGTLWHLQKCF